MATSLIPTPPRPPTLYNQRRRAPTAIGTSAIPGSLTAPSPTLTPGVGDANPPAPPPGATSATPPTPATPGTNNPSGPGTYADPLGVAGGSGAPDPRALVPKGPASPDAPAGAPTTPVTPAAATPRLAPPSSPTDLGGMLPAVNTTMPPNTTTAGTGQFGPGNDLRYSTVLPTTSARTAGTQGLVDAAAQGVAQQNLPTAIGSYADQFAKRLPSGQVAMPSVATDVNAGPAVNATDSSELQNFKALQDNAAGAVGNGASRQSIAQTTLDAFDQAAQPQIRDQIRSVGQQASKFGRLGMGDTAVETLRPYTDYLNNRAVLSKQLAADTASGDIQDRLNNLSATQGLVGQQAGLESANRNEARTERGYSTDIAAQNLARQTAERNATTGQANTNADRAYQTAANALGLGLGAAQTQGTEARANAGTLSSLEGQQAGEDTTAQNATRGERQYQADTGQQAIQNALNQYLTEQGAQNQTFNQGATLAQLGLSGNAINSILANAGLSGADASSAYDAIAKLLGPALAGSTAKTGG